MVYHNPALQAQEEDEGLPSSFTQDLDCISEQSVPW